MKKTLKTLLDKIEDDLGGLVRLAQMWCNSVLYSTTAKPDAYGILTTEWAGKRGTWHKTSRAHQTLLIHNNCLQTTRMEVCRQVKCKRCNNPLKYQDGAESYLEKGRVCLHCSRRSHCTKCCTKEIRQRDTSRDRPMRMGETPWRTLVRGSQTEDDKATGTNETRMKDNRERTGPATSESLEQPEEF